MFADFVKFCFLALEGRYLRRLNYFELYPFFALLLNLMTNQSYAQVTIAYNTVDSSILQRQFFLFFLELESKPIVLQYDATFDLLGAFFEEL